MKKIGVILSILTVLTLSFITKNNVSAVSDISVTYTSSTDTMLCANDISSVPSCTDYKYLLIETNFGINTYSAQTQIIYFLDGNNTTNTYVSLNSPKVILSVEGFSRVRILGIQNSNVLPSGWSVTYTLSENNPAGGITPEGTLDVVANGSYDVTNYASVDVQVEESSFIVQLFSQGFWGVATAIVTIIVPIIALFLVFRLVHDLLWGRG